MAITIKEMFKNKIPKDDMDLVTVSDEIWKLGTIEEIKEKLSPELFTVHVGMNVIGNHQSDGWWSILDYQQHLIPYIPQVLDKLGLHEIKIAFQKVTSLVPDSDEHEKEVEELDNLSDAFWGLSAPDRGWESVLNYAKENYDK